MPTREDYTSSSILVLEGLNPVRRRPGMYTDTSRPNHLLQEVVDNCVDEVLAGFASCISVSLNADRSVRVADNGRGMPVDVHPVHGTTGVELIMTTLHAGAKFDNESYRFAGGLHGVGVSVVNALSKWVEVEVKQGGQIYKQRFEEGQPVTSLEVVGTVGKKNTGTVVTFEPDGQFFEVDKIALQRTRHLLRAKAILCKGLEVSLTYLENNRELTEQWQYEDGLSQYLIEETKSERVPIQPFYHSSTGERESLAVAWTWVSDPTEQLSESYVNLIPTPLGGSHVNGMRSGIAEALREFCEFRNLLPRGVKLTADDAMKGCSFVLSAMMQEPQFSGQTKERLSSREATTFISSATKDSFSLWLNEHPTDGTKIAEGAIAQAQERIQSSKKVKRKTYAAGPTLPGKLADCTSQDPEQTELFLVEGDSAGGTAVQARDREFQAVLPLRGKIMNTWEIDSKLVMNSQTVVDIAQAIGVEPGAQDCNRLRYGKICILADADSDGAHIATLLCALFLKHFPDLVDKGHIFVAMPPLYRIDVGKQVFYTIDDAERVALLDRLKREKVRGEPVVQRFKGLGEMNPLQLRETTISVKARRLVQLTIDQPKITHDVMDMLLARKRSRDRREWLEANGDQTEVLRFENKEPVAVETWN